MRLSHAALVAHERRFPAGHREGYAGYTQDMEQLREAFYSAFVDGKVGKQPTVNEVIAAFGALPPEEFTAPYDIPAETLERLGRTVQRKYIVRFKNIRRSWAILLQHMPELIAEGCAPRDVLEMSTAHGATLEILQHFGHRVLGNDFPNFLGRNPTLDTRFRNVNDFDLAHERDDHGLLDGDGQVSRWPYQPIIESIGLKVDLFDAGRLPYPYPDGRFDTVLCFDAIEHYCHPKDWLLVVAEFCRLARRSVLLITNPVQPHMLNDAVYMDSFYRFQSAMRSYDRDGFQCISAGINRNQLTVYKLMRTAAAPAAPRKTAKATATAKPPAAKASATPRRKG